MHCESKLDGEDLLQSVPEPDSKPGAKPGAASQHEVQAAINQLTEVELIRLIKFAVWRIRGLGRRAAGRTHEDLLHEAIYATLDGRRNWYKDRIDFVGHLLGAIRSISDNWSHQQRNIDHESVLASELNYQPPQCDDNFTNLSQVAPRQEEELIIKQRQASIEALFENDTLANLIICELKDGMKLGEIRAKYGLQQHVFEAAMKRIRRRLARHYEEES